MFFRFKRHHRRRTTKRQSWAIRTIDRQEVQAEVLAVIPGKHYENRRFDKQAASSCNSWCTSCSTSDWDRGPGPVRSSTLSNRRPAPAARNRWFGRWRPAHCKSSCNSSWSKFAPSGFFRRRTLRRRSPQPQPRRTERPSTAWLPLPVFSRPRHYSPVAANEECSSAMPLKPSGCSRASPQNRAPSHPSDA